MEQAVFDQVYSLIRRAPSEASMAHPDIYEATLAILLYRLPVPGALSTCDNATSPVVVPLLV